MTRVLVRWRHWSGHRETENMETVTVVSPTKDNCTWLWYNLWQWGWRRVDRRCVMSVCREHSGMFVPFLVSLVLLLLSDAVKPDNNGGRLLRQNVNYFQVPGMRWLWFGLTFIIPINFMSNPGHFGMKQEIFLLSQGFSSVSLFIFSTNVFLYFGAKDTWPWIRNWEKKANPHSLIWFV